MPSLAFYKATKQHKAFTMRMAVRIIKKDVTMSGEGDDRQACWKTAQGKQQTEVLAGPGNEEQQEAHA